MPAKFFRVTLFSAQFDANFPHAYFVEERNIQWEASKSLSL